MPTTILDGESLEQAYARRFREEAEIDKRIQDAYEQCDKLSQHTNPADDRLDIWSGEQ